MTLSNKQLLDKTVEIWGKKHVAEALGKHHSEVTKWLALENGPRLDDAQMHLLLGNFGVFEIISLEYGKKC